MVKSYALVDSGNGQRLERFGEYTCVRPCSQALWKPALDKEVWARADARFSRDVGEGGWRQRGNIPKEWPVEHSGLLFNIAPTDFGHLGLFPEHSFVWEQMRMLLRGQKSRLSVLNLFAYSGGATLAAAQAGAQVCHLDASKGMVSWARENAKLNGLSNAPIRWIVDDVFKFLKREIKRNVFYDGLILDPPTFGRGNKGEIFKLERDIQELLGLCRSVLSKKALFVFFTSHTAGVSPQVLHQLLSQMMSGLSGEVKAQEMLLLSEQGCSIASGSVAQWVSNNL